MTHVFADVGRGIPVPFYGIRKITKPDSLLKAKIYSGNSHTLEQSAVNFNANCQVSIFSNPISKSPKSPAPHPRKLHPTRYIPTLSCFLKLTVY